MNKEIHFHSKIYGVLLKNKKNTTYCNVGSSFVWDFPINNSLEDDLYYLEFNDYNNFFYNKKEKQWYLKIDNNNISTLLKEEIFFGKCNPVVFSKNQPLYEVRQFLSEKKSKIMNAFQNSIVDKDGKIFCKINIFFDNYLNLNFSISDNFFKENFISAVNFIKIGSSFEYFYEIFLTNRIHIMKDFSLKSVKDSSQFDGFIEDQLSSNIKPVVFNDEDRNKFIYLYGEDFFKKTLLILNNFSSEEKSVALRENLMKRVNEKYSIIEKINHSLENKKTLSI